MEGGIIRTRCIKVGSSAVPKTKLRGLESRLKRSFVLSGFEGMKVFFLHTCPTPAIIHPFIPSPKTSKF